MPKPKEKKNNKPYPIALACADLHLSLKRPACREDDWMEVQAGYLKQLRKIQAEATSASDEDGPRKCKQVPILCAGDIFDRWNVQPELINFALKHLPDGMVCIPGQHDLPNHRLEEMHRSAYGVLVESKKIVDITNDGVCTYGLSINGFGWGQEIKPPSEIEGLESLIKVALVHKFIWTDGTGYPGAPEESRWPRLMPKLKGYQVVVFGDNHKPFKIVGDTTIFNCGGFIRRKIDDDHRPRVGIIFSNGDIIPKFLDTSGDKIRRPEEVQEVGELDLKKFITDLETLGDAALDFAGIVRRHLESSDLSGAVRERVLKCLENGADSRL